MDQQLSPADKKYIYDLLADEFIQGLKVKYLGKYEQKILSRKILDNIDKSRIWGEVINFIDNYSKIYSFFQPAASVFKAKISQGNEAQIINKLETYIKSSPSVN